MTAPDQRAFEADVAKATFRLAVTEERWRLLKTVWPYVYFSITAGDRRKHVVRLNVAGYPQVGPTGGPWDMDRDQILAFDLWPRGSGGRVSAVFRHDWQNGAALYHPFDRVSWDSHSNWRNEMPAKVWTPVRGISQYLEALHELLNSRDYMPAVRATA